MLRKYKVLLAIDNKIIEIQDEVETNFKAGEASQMAHLFYRAMLANGFPPAVACEALGKVAAAGGYIHGGVMGEEDAQAGFNFDGQGAGL